MNCLFIGGGFDGKRVDFINTPPLRFRTIITHTYENLDPVCNGDIGIASSYQEYKRETLHSGEREYFVYTPIDHKGEDVIESLINGYLKGETNSQ